MTQRLTKQKRACPVTEPTVEFGGRDQEFDDIGGVLGVEILVERVEVSRLYPFAEDHDRSQDFKRSRNCNGGGP